MFGEKLPPWDINRKYSPQNLQVSIFYFDLLVSFNSFWVILPLKLFSLVGSNYFAILKPLFLSCSLKTMRESHYIKSTPRSLSLQFFSIKGTECIFFSQNCLNSLVYCDLLIFSQLFPAYLTGVKAGTPSFVILVKGSPFCEKFLSERKTQLLTRSLHQST